MGWPVGSEVGCDGRDVGDDDGKTVGFSVGCAEGSAVGHNEGQLEGKLEGKLVGKPVGSNVGADEYPVLIEEGPLEALDNTMLGLTHSTRKIVIIYLCICDVCNWFSSLAALVVNKNSRRGSPQYTDN